MPDVVLIRPGCTDFDEQNRIQGVLDLPLNHRGHAQVLGLVAQLQEVEFDIIFTAPSEPARSTALAICEQNGSSLKEVEDFRNLDHGLWQGLPVDDVRRKYPKVFKQWQESPETVCLPEGETVAEAVERIRRGLRKCLKRKRTIGIVASEPLATMIGCVLRGQRPSLPESCDRKSLRPTIERISLATPELPEPPAVAPNGKSATGSAADASPTNGKPTNGKSPANGAQSPNGTASGSGAPPTNGTQAVNGRSVTLPKSRKDNGNGKDAGNGNGTSSAAGTGPASTSKRGTHE
jgi:broad specificity phosphatase PhoE